MPKPSSWSHCPSLVTDRTPVEAPQDTLSLAPLPTAEKLPLSPAVATGTDGLPGPTRGTCSVLEATDLAGLLYGH